MTNEVEHFQERLRRTVRARMELPGAGFEDRLLAALRLPPAEVERPARRPALALASAALAVTVVAAMLLTSPGVRQHLLTRTTAPVSQPPPTATPDPGAAGTYFYQAATVRTANGLVLASPAGPLHRADWTGAARGSLDLAGTVAVSPDGRYVLQQGPDPAVRLLDASGALVATVPVPAGTWATDSQHLCALSGPPDDEIVVTEILPDRRVVRSAIPVQGIDGYRALIGCSVQRDVAVLLGGQTGTGLAGPNAKSALVDTVQLSTGRVAQLALPAGQLTLPMMSPDGRFLAIERTGQRPVTFVIDLTTGSVVASLPGVAAGFSGDGRLLAMNGTSNWTMSTVSIVDWRTGHAIWQRQRAAIEDVRVLPGGEDLVLDLAHDSTVDVVLVRRDGRSLTVAQRASLVTQAGLVPPVG